MLFTHYFFFLLLILICELTNNTDQNNLSLLIDNHERRIKRFLSYESSESELNNQTRSENNQSEDILLNSKLYDENNQEKQSQSETNKGFTEQELAEIQRILSKKEDDYYGILHINNYATRDEIINAYKKFTLRVHPDKFNVPGATQATQRLNKARAELLKKFENQDQNYNQQRTKIFTTRSTSINENKNFEVTETINKSNAITPFSSSPSTRKKEISKTSSFFNKFTYLLFAFIIFIVGILIFIIFWKKRQPHLLSNAKISKKQNIPPTYDTPESNDGNIIDVNEDSEASIVQDEE